MCLLSESAYEGLPLVLDSSVLINLNGSGIPAVILSALSRTVVVTSVVQSEVAAGLAKGHSDSATLRELEQNEIIRIGRLGPPAESTFQELVAGSVVDTLDDGEAATIAHAIEIGGIAAIDERKATRILGQRFPSLPAITTIDIFQCPVLEHNLGRDALVNAVFLALTATRMLVPVSKRAWVLNLLGDRSGQCTSLRR